MMAMIAATVVELVHGSFSDAVRAQFSNQLRNALADGNVQSVAVAPLASGREVSIVIGSRRSAERFTAQVSEDGFVWYAMVARAEEAAAQPVDFLMEQPLRELLEQEDLVGLIDDGSYGVGWLGDAGGWVAVDSQPVAWIDAVHDHTSGIHFGRALTDAIAASDGSYSALPTPNGMAFVFAIEGERIAVRAILDAQGAVVGYARGVAGAVPSVDTRGEREPALLAARALSHIVRTPGGWQLQFADGSAYPVSATEPGDGDGC